MSFKSSTGTMDFYVNNTSMATLNGSGLTINNGSLTCSTVTCSSINFGSISSLNCTGTFIAHSGGNNQFCVGGEGLNNYGEGVWSGTSCAGLQVGWNRDSGTGATCFLCSGQGGGGGFEFYSIGANNQYVPAGGQTNGYIKCGFINTNGNSITCGPIYNNVFSTIRNGSCLGYYGDAPYYLNIIQLPNTAGQNASRQWNLINQNNNGTFLILGGNGGVVNAGVYIGCNDNYWTSWSDERIKTNMNDVEPSLNKLLNLKPITFKMIDHVNDGIDELKVGFTAQNVGKYFPLVGGFESGFKKNIIDDTGNQVEIDVLGFSPTNMIPYIVKSIQEQNDIIVNLSNTIQSQEQAMQELQSTIKRQDEKINEILQKLNMV